MNVCLEEIKTFHSKSHFNMIQYNEEGGNMPGFSDVLGHEQTIAHMKSAIEANKYLMRICWQARRIRQEDAGRYICQNAAV